MRTIDALRRIMKPGRRYSLRIALIAFVVIPVVLALGVVALATQRVITGFAERRMQEEVELVASTISLPLGRALAAGRGRDVERALRSAIRADPVYAVFVYNARGIPLAAVGEEALPVSVDVLSRVVVDQEKVGGYTRLGRRRVYSVTLPLRGSAGEPVGMVQVLRRRRDFDEALARLRLQTFVILIFSCVGVSGLVLWGHDRAVGRALHRLEDDIERIDRTGGDHRSEATGPREVSRVADALNAMLDKRYKDEAEILARRDKQLELEERLRHAEKLAAVGRLASGLAHELGTPLSVIDGHAQRELRRRREDDDDRGVMLQVRGEVERMSAIVRQLLDFARRPKAQSGQVDIFQVVEAAVLAVGQTNSGQAANIEVVPPRNRPKARGDSAALERVLINLIDNAIAAAGEDSSNAVVRVFLTTDQDTVCMSVEDSGPGVEAHLRQRIFEPFFTTKPVGQGTGLGLAVVHGLMEEQGGEVDVCDSELGGARFDIRLSRVTDEKEDDA